MTVPNSGVLSPVNLQKSAYCYLDLSGSNELTYLDALHHYENSNPFQMGFYWYPHLDDPILSIHIDLDYLQHWPIIDLNHCYLIRSLQSLNHWLWAVHRTIQLWDKARSVDCRQGWGSLRMDGWSEGSLSWLRSWSRTGILPLQSGLISRNDSLLCHPMGGQMIAMWVNRLEREGLDVTYFADNTRLMQQKSIK